MCHWMYISVSVRLVERGYYPIRLNISVSMSLFRVPCIHFDSFIHVSYIMYITEAAMLGMVRLGGVVQFGGFFVCFLFCFCFIKHS